MVGYETRQAQSVVTIRPISWIQMSEHEEIAGAVTQLMDELAADEWEDVALLNMAERWRQWADSEIVMAKGESAGWLECAKKLERAVDIRRKRRQ